MDSLAQLTKDILSCQPEKHHGLWKGGRKVAQHRWNVKESSKTKKREYYQRTKTIRCQRGKERRLGIKIDVCAHYGGGVIRCVHCGFVDIRALTIDHIKNDGSSHRRRENIGTGEHFYRWLKVNGYPEGYQTLCWNCQYIKRAENNG